MSKLYIYAGIVASIVLIAFGAGSLYMGFDGRDQVRSDLAREQIVGTPDSTIPGQTVNAETGKPVENGLRNMWVTSTALSTALNTAYFAESVATFAIVMGVAMLLTGLGFLVLIIRVLVPVGSPAKTARGTATAIPA